MSSGTVYLVGSGPGDPGLLTVRGLELIKSADAIFHDRLIPPSLLGRAKPGCEIVYVGKTPGVEADRDGTVGQGEITQRLIEAAGRHRSVLRLKGGDPFVFGRGGEEIEALRDAGIRFEVVPGVTAGVAAPAYAGIPVTHREEASGVAFVTGHESEDSPAIDWQSLARFPGTLVLYMSVRRLAANASALIEAGRLPQEPAAVIESGTLPEQRVVHGALEEIAQRASEQGVRAPALVVVGPVAERGEQLAWFGQGPLRGRTVVVTRARAQASGLSSRLRSLGARVVELPLIRIEGRAESQAARDAVTALHSYALLAVTSANAVEFLFEAMAVQGRDARALANATVAAIGPATAEALSAHGITADLVAERSVSEGLVEVLEPVAVEGRPVLLAGAAGSRSLLADRLSERGAQVDQLALYETVAEPVEPAALQAAQEADFVTLASASATTNLAQALGQAADRPDLAGFHPTIISIGPITSAAARDLGFSIAREADPHTVDGLITALLDAAGVGDGRAG